VLTRTFVLVDARHGLKPQDREILGVLDRAAVSYAIVLTKIDTMPWAAMQRRIAETEAGISKRPAAFPRVFAISSRTGSGLMELRGAIARLLSERGIRL
jgi:GTP-binding protein